MIEREEEMCPFARSHRRREPAGNFEEADHGDEQPPGEKQHALERLGPHHRYEAAVHGIRAGEDGQPPYAREDRKTEQTVHHIPAGKEHPREVDREIARQCEEREDRARGRAIPAFEIFGNGEYPRLK